MGGGKILQEIIAPPFSVIKIVKYCGVGEGGIGAPKYNKKIMAPPSLSLRLLSIVASGEGGIGHGGAKILKKK